MNVLAVVGDTKSTKKKSTNQQTESSLQVGELVFAWLEGADPIGLAKVF